MIHQVRVIFGDTDQMGVVYYANYLRYFEASRAAFFRDLGRTGRDLDRWGVAFPVVEASARYHKPARYEDVLDVDVTIGELRAASLRFVYEVRREADVIATGFTRHCCIRSDGRPTRFPPELATLIRNAVDR